MSAIPIAQALDRALRHHQAGQLAQAEALYREILARDPWCADALHLLGVIAHQVGRNDTAVELIGRAIALAPRNAAFHANLGEAFRHLRRLDDAVASFRQALALQPNSPDALNNLASALTAQGRFDEALACFQQAIALRPKFATAHYNLGTFLKARGRLDDALACFRRALELEPNLAEAHNNLGIILKEQGRLDDALACFRQTLALAPGLAEAHHNLGVICQERGRLEEAAASFQRAVALKPDYAEAHLQLGVVLKERREFDPAVACFKRALALKPDSAEAHNQLGIIFKECGRPDEALGCYQRALALQPEFAEAHNNLGNLLKERGQLDDALGCYEKARGLRPDRPDIHSNLILTLYYRSGEQAEVIDAELRRWNQQHARPQAALLPPHANDRSPTRALRIGYVSPDFRSHPVGWFLLPLFAGHDRQAFELFCYSNVQLADRVTAQLRSGTTGWRELAGRTDREAAQMIRDDRIDILVDLSLHTARSRLPLFAYKPAPVQATYLAYPGNSGLETIDYRITDPHLDPPGDEIERGFDHPIRLPQTYWCYQPLVEPAPEAGPLPVLSTGHITFSCLNNFCKVTPAAIAAWCRLLAAVPGSRLILHAHPGSHRTHVANQFAGHQIDPQRVHFVGRAPKPQYFESYRSVDIALDPFPFPGGTTTCDALWMGVPVISLVGPTPVTRSGLSLLSNVGLSELAARSVDEYIERAVTLARDLPRLAGLRAGLRERMQGSPLMDAPGFARAIEAAYRTMWRRWCTQPENPPRLPSPSPPA